MSLLVNLGYVLMLFAFLARDVLLLRSLAVIAQLIVTAYTYSLGVYLVSSWNLLFACINIVWVVLILRERRSVRVPDELEALYARHFSALSPREFLRWWNLGRDETLQNERLTTNGQRPGGLYFLIDGAVRISRDSQTVTELPSGHFVAEMSMITGEPANADVDAVGRINVRQWAEHDLRTIREREPSLWIKIQSVIGLDLVSKIRRIDTDLVTN